MRFIYLIIFICAFLIGLLIGYHPFVYSFIHQNHVTRMVFGLKDPVPKIIHYVWIGGKPLYPRAQQAIESWKQYAPDYEIMRWDESNCDVFANPFVRGAYEKKDFSVASDWCRYQALYEYGGIYFDVDHYVKGDISDMLKSDISFSFQDAYSISASGIAVKPHHPLIKDIINMYASQKTYVRKNGPQSITDLIFQFFPELKKNGTYQKIDKSGKILITLFPANFYMFDYGGIENKATHNYHNGTSYSQFGNHYRLFYQYFLNDFAYPIATDTHTLDYLVPLWDGRYYKISDKIPVRISVEQDTLKIYGPKGINEVYIKEQQVYKLQQKASE